MTTYAAFVRGVGRGNPMMSSANFKRAFESLGFVNVATVIASGNIVFQTKAQPRATLEKKIEAMFPKELSFSRIAIIRSQQELQKLVARNPFKGVPDEKPMYLVVTFFKNGKEESTAIDLSKTDGPQLMRDLEKKHGKDITTRTWKTIGRVLKKMESLD